ncbi:MAG: DsbA family protein [Bacillota bacterium]|nr:DsbA family protein [Bacillota bacterium]
MNDPMKNQTPMISPDVADANPVVDFYYFTDPVCSHCWALEGVMNRIKHEYANHLNVVTVMGGMMENAASPDEAAEMAEHWSKIALYYNIPIDGKLWTESTLSSTWPPSISYLVLRDRDPIRAARFLRLVREAAFLDRRDVGTRDVLRDLLIVVDADAESILDVAFSEAGRGLLLSNMKPMVEFDITAFPTVVIVNQAGEGVKIVGVRTAETYRKTIERMLPPGTVLTSQGSEPLEDLLDRIPTLFDNEVEKIYEIKKDDFLGFIAANLSAGTYETGERLGHRYVRRPLN